ncbi:MAG TPA: LamG-like jellyroll fold domain-containing protein, partial [Chitinophagaceae bacterium]|nr:LamG-like jellyroll fold domain-containing protein [Chitinophagaceae bacterium]
SVVFAEEGKRKELISYFDGTLRNRQSVTLNNTDNKNVVQETIYDALGRPAMNILPAPTKDSTIHYFRGFNKNSGGSNPYSFSDLGYASCTTDADSVSHSSGTGQYYSTSNSFLGDFYYAKYIPNAGGYSFAVTEYMADHTGRIKAQGGVGAAFQMGSGHETKYFYGKPTQKELDRLFGLEAGNSSHYLKNMVVDPNGQVSVSYMNASGKIIATALAGGVPATMHALSSSSGASVNVSNDLILPGDFTRNAGDYSMTASATFLAPVTGTYIFSYNVDSLVYRKLYGANKDSVICSNCYYDLEVLVKDDCENILRRDTVAAGAVFDTTCSNPPSSIKDSIHVSVSKIGEYYVTFNLRVSRDALAFYDSVHLVKNTEIKKLNYFLLEELKQTDFYGCYNNCATCFDKLGTKPEFTANFKTLFTGNQVLFGAGDSLWTGQLYDSLYANCASLQEKCGDNICNEKLELLKRDVSPGGQYGMYDTSSYDLLEIPINRIAMRGTIDWFPDEFGARDSVMLVDINGEDSVKVDVTQLNDSNFIKYWRDSWADSLAKLHPEYCFYLWCTQNSESNQFDRDVEDMMDADTAMARDWFDPADYKELLDADPFFTDGGNGVPYYEQMKDSLRLFSRTLVGFAQSDKNLLQFVDLILYCTGVENCDIWDECSPDNDCRSRNREWFLYKLFYLNLKKKFYEEARLNNVSPIFSNCSNCFIGKDLAAGIFTCPEYSDFTFENPAYPTWNILYKNGTNGGVLRKTFVRLKYFNPFSGSYSHFDDVFNVGDSIHVLVISDGFIDSILFVRCDSTSWEPFVDTLCSADCGFDTGVRNPYDRDSISFYIETGNPYTAPGSVPSGYAGCRFYPEFVLHTGPSTVCRLTNVWVCVKDSTCPGGVGVCYGDNIPSTCEPTGDDTLYRNKLRRYPEYINTSDFLSEMQSQNPQQGSDNMEELMEQCKSTCEAQADIWMNTLRRCNNMSPTDSSTLRYYLIDICSRGCSETNPFGTSSIPGSTPATYHSFEEAITAIIGSPAPNDSCTQELLAMPYPYNRQPVYTETMITATDSAICARLHYYDSSWQASGYTGSFHSWLTIQLGSSYTLDSLELDDLINSCGNCNYILKNDILLPAPFMPGAPPCLTCDSVQTALTAFEAKFPGLTTANDDYETLLTNFFNHRFGYALTYYHYRSYLDKCDTIVSYSGKLCNLPMQQDVVVDDNFACTAELFGTALTNAWNIYVVYIDSVRWDFREAWTTKCMNAQPKLNMTADLYEYHYTLYYYDQSGNLVKTIPPEGVQLLDNGSIASVQAIRAGANPSCSNNNSMVFTNGSVDFPGGTAATQMNVGSGAFTIETWINLSSLSNQGIVSNNHWNSGGSYNNGYSLGIISNKLVLHMGENNASFKVEATSPTLTSYLPLNAWTHIAVQRTGAGTVKMFINGNQLPVTYTSNTPSTRNLDHASTDAFYTGASNKGGSLSKLSSGKLRHVRVYRRALPAAEIRQNYNDFCGNPSGTGDLVFWEVFTEGSFTTSGGNDYVYDRIYNSAGQKSGTIAFETSGSNTLVPAHRLVTTYQYNSLNHVLQQYTPDGDSSWFYYDRLGRLTASQNKEQKDNSSYSGSSGRFSYSKYDSLGRITEVGEKSTGTDIRTINLLKQDSVVYWLGLGTNRQLTKTIYDNPVNLNLQQYNTSRKRVVASIYLETSSAGEGDSTLYTYDILGNVKTLVQHVKALVAVDATNGRKRIDYDYDLVSGKVNMVSYQHGKGDQFYYKYSYDADNRVIRSYSSRDKLLWIEDASYNYYLHGPLARTELG